MYIITSKVNTTFETIGKATGVKMTGKAVGKKNCVSVKNNLDNLNKWSWSKARLQKILNNIFFSFKTGFFASASFSLNENLLLLNSIVHFFHLVPCIREF